MRYFEREDFDKCTEFLADKPDTVETQQELYKFMHGDYKMVPDCNQITVKDMAIYSKVYLTSNNPSLANWCTTMSNGSQVVWNRKYQEFYTVNTTGMNRCDYIDYLSVFTEITGIDTWLLENWSRWRFQKMQKQLIAIWCGRYNQFFHNFWRCYHD